MTQEENTIRVYSSDDEINALCSRTGSGKADYTRHFDQNQEYFLRLSSPVTVSSFPVHHNVSRGKPEKRYRTAVRDTIASITSLIPEVFSGLTYAFDPLNILSPKFFHVYRIGSKNYLYVLRLNLLFRPLIHQIVRDGTNDITPAYRTNRVFLETDCIPLEDIETVNCKISRFRLDQMISSTWIGETGRGYRVQGIWMDQDLTKFLSRLFMPSDLRIHPYYPFSCKYRSICYFPFIPAEEGRRKGLPLLHRGIAVLAPYIEEIEKVLKRNKFSEDLPLFKKIRKEIPEAWKALFAGLKIRAYLNEQEMKEYMFEIK